MYFSTTLWLRRMVKTGMFRGGKDSLHCDKFYLPDCRRERFFHADTVAMLTENVHHLSPCYISILKQQYPVLQFCLKDNIFGIIIYYQPVLEIFFSFVADVDNHMLRNKA